MCRKPKQCTTIYLCADGGWQQTSFILGKKIFYIISFGDQDREEGDIGLSWNIYIACLVF